jgi:hypothetical protein
MYWLSILNSSGTVADKAPEKIYLLYQLACPSYIDELSPCLFIDYETFEAFNRSCGRVKQV